jgi:hypothetical protein
MVEMKPARLRLLHQEDAYRKQAMKNLRQAIELFYCTTYSSVKEEW